jgi:hypothetical protein
MSPSRLRGRLGEASLPRTQKALERCSHLFQLFKTLAGVSREIWGQP